MPPVEDMRRPRVKRARGRVGWSSGQGWSPPGATGCSGRLASPGPNLRMRAGSGAPDPSQSRRLRAARFPDDAIGHSDSKASFWSLEGTIVSPEQLSAVRQGQLRSRMAQETTHVYGSRRQSRPERRPAHAI